MQTAMALTVGRSARSRARRTKNFLKESGTGNETLLDVCYPGLQLSNDIHSHGIMHYNVCGFGLSIALLWERQAMAILRQKRTVEHDFKKRLEKYVTMLFIIIAFL